MADKQYISIIRLLEHCGISMDEELNLSRVKKQLNAEFDFAKEGFIGIEGYHYNKHDVFEELDREDFASRMPYHKKLWEHKALLTVLEDNQLNLPDVQEEFMDFQNDNVFDAFLSPYFAIPFNHICRNFLNDKELHDLSSWLMYNDFLLPQNREEAFRSVRVFLEENMRLFKNISKENYKSFRPQIVHWIDYGWDEFLNYLPEEFYFIKNEITVELINLTVKIQKSHKKDCKAISKGLMRLNDLPPGLVDTIYNNNKAYNNTGGKSFSGGGALIWVGIILVKIIVSSGGCN